MWCCLGLGQPPSGMGTGSAGRITIPYNQYSVTVWCPVSYGFTPCPCTNILTTIGRGTISTLRSPNRAPDESLTPRWPSVPRPAPHPTRDTATLGAPHGHGRRRAASTIIDTTVTPEVAKLEGKSSSSSSLLRPRPRSAGSGPPPPPATASWPHHRCRRCAGGCKATPNKRTAISQRC